MPRHRTEKFLPFLSPLIALILAAILFPASGLGQGMDTALLRGMVVDPSGATVPSANVTITDVATGVSTRTATNGAGLYIFNAVKPDTYTVRVQAQGFKTTVRSNVVLVVGQQTDVEFRLELGTTQQTVEVSGAPPLLNTVTGALGSTLTNRMISALPLSGLDITSLSYFAPAVTEVTGSNIDTLGGTNFVSNGQRNATAEFLQDGLVITHPEGGEGSTTIANYLPIPDGMQEFRLQNNSFSAAYGNNGGTVVSIITKSGTNAFHGSGFYLMQRPGFDANDFFSNLGGAPKGTFAFDQYGGSIGGPIRKDKTFFFIDLLKERNNSPFTIVTTVPTALQRAGDFSQTYNADGTLQQIFNPFAPSCSTVAGTQNCTRQPFPGNVIPPGMMNPVWQKVINLYPMPNTAGQPLTDINNYTQKLVSTNPQYQYDIRVDQNFSQKSRLMGRYSVQRITSNSPDPFLAPAVALYNTDEGMLEHVWTLTPTLLWTNRVGIVRWVDPMKVLSTVNPLTIGFPKQLIDNVWYDQPNFPDVSVSGYQGLVTDACCTNTLETDTQWSMNSVMTKVAGGHNITFGGEHRIFLNNFFQPSDTSGGFCFGQDVTMQNVFIPNTDQGNGLASMLLDWADSGSVGELPHVANRSAETAFFFQDDWKMARRLTLDFGLRYEWSTPYTERYNRNQFSCFTCDSGIRVPALPGLAGIWPAGGREIFGTTVLATPGHRAPGTDWDNVGPRLGFAYQLTPNTVVRGGAGIYYGMNYATNWQYGGANWQGSANMLYSLDGNITRFANIANLFPAGFLLPEETKYGAQSQWGYNDGNHAGLDAVNAHIYMWNFGVQRQLPGSVMLEVDYSASRSTNLPWNYNPANRDFPTDAQEQKYGSAGLGQVVPNPFQYLFTSVNGSTPRFNAPGSIYNFSTIPLINLIEPYPQFGGYFTGFPPFGAGASYNALEVQFQKRYSHGLTFAGNYTFSRFMSDSDEGGNAWIGRLTAGEPQDLNNLAAEQSVSANDTPSRLTFAVTYELPVGRGRTYGSNMNRALDGFLGGWSLTPWVTFQSGQPLDITDGNGALASGVQRPNVTGNPCSGDSPYAIINGNSGANYFNLSAFSHAADQMPGNAPRYFSSCRVPGINNIDASLAKELHFTESKYLQIRAEFFNATNTVRFSAPGASFGSTSFGEIGSITNGPRSGQLVVRFIF